MEIQVSTLTASKEIKFAPLTEIEEIIQNVRTIITTPIYSVPLDRLFGTKQEMLDLPMPVAQARLSAEIVQAVQRFEPRVIVTEVSYSSEGIDGRLHPIVRFKIKE